MHGILLCFHSNGFHKKHTQITRAIADRKSHLLGMGDFGSVWKSIYMCICVTDSKKLFVKFSIYQTAFIIPLPTHTNGSNA